MGPATAFTTTTRPTATGRNAGRNAVFWGDGARRSDPALFGSRPVPRKTPTPGRDAGVRSKIKHPPETTTAYSPLADPAFALHDKAIGCARVPFP
jgi:hypothetical protein